MYQNNEKFLKIGLSLNALTAAMYGALLLLNTHGVAQAIFTTSDAWFGINAELFLTVIGAGLLIFCAFIAFVLTRPITPTVLVKAISIADAGWVLGTVGLLFALPAILSSFGFLMAVLVGSGVAIVALLQVIGLVFLYQGRTEIGINGDGATSIIRARRVVNIPAEDVWKIVSDHEGYADVAENLSKVEVISGEGVGMVRKCWDNQGNSWTEQASAWDEGTRFEFTVNTAAQDYPFPLVSLRGVWEVDKIDNSHSAILMDFHVRREATFKGRVIGRLMTLLFSGALDRLIERWIVKMGTA